MVVHEHSTRSQNELKNNDDDSWSPTSWTMKPIMQEPLYPKDVEAQDSISKLARLPPLVLPGEILKLKAELKKVALGQAFVIQGGDCAELFDYCEQNSIESKIKLLLQLSMILTYGANKPVVRIGRLAGQYAKPRSSPTEIVDGKEIPSFRGDILNGYGLDQRTLDPKRLVEYYPIL